MKNLETTEQLLEGLKEFSKTTTRASHSIYFSNRKNQWVVSLTNNGKTFYADTIIEAMELAYVFIQLNRTMTKTGYILHRFVDANKTIKGV
jgi:hypothetical protein